MRKEQHDKLKVLQLNKLYYPTIGGIEKVVKQIAEGLNEEVEMSVLTCAEGKHFITERLNGVQVYRVPSLFRIGSLPVPFGLTRQLRKLMKEQDVIHLHMPFPFGDLACLMSGYKGKIVVWWHSDVVRQKKMMLFYKPVMVRMLKRADAIIVATEGNLEGSAYLKPFRKKCVFIPFGIDKETEKAADRTIHQQTELRKTEKTRFLFVGRLVYYKGCDVLLKAFVGAENAILTVVGSGKMEKELKRLTRTLGIEDKVRFLGEVSEAELYKQYGECDVFVLPSVAKSEAFGLVQLEAMVFGKPVINTKLPSGVPYVSLHKLTGLTVPPGDIKALSEAVIWMGEHEEERLEMGKRARKRVEEEYRLDTMLKRVLEIYQSL